MQRRTAWLDHYAAVGALATVAAIRRSEPARLFGLRFPGTVAMQAATIGTGISAPLPALLIAPLVGRLRGGSASTALAAAFLVGALGEPATWRVGRSPSRDRLLSGVVLVNVVLPLLVLVPRSR
jgi:hypothetical protein